jgi:hypothetical protein
MKTISLFVIASLMMFWSCSEKEESIRNYSLDGLVQKGPFINGTQVEIIELNDQLAQTGKSYKTEIRNDLGEFEIEDIGLSSNYVELMADGFYFNEINGLLSSSRLFLRALSDISNRSSVNINILTHLEPDRIKYLIKDGLNFSEAKQKAHSELLEYFNASIDDICNFEDLNISSESTENGFLIAISAIFQYNNTVADLSKLIADFKNDFENDGVINDQKITDELVNNATRIDTLLLRSNLNSRYQELGRDITFPRFEGYILKFIEKYDSSFFLQEGDILFPEFGKYGLNIIHNDSFDTLMLSKNTSYSITAIFPEINSKYIHLSFDSLMYGSIEDTTGMINIDLEKAKIWESVSPDNNRFRGYAVNDTADMKVLFSGFGFGDIFIETYNRVGERVDFFRSWIIWD